MGFGIQRPWRTSMIIQRQAAALKLDPVQILWRDSMLFHRDAMIYRTNQLA
jgi:hypothetical protein